MPQEGERENYRHARLVPFRESSVVKAHEKLSPSQQVTPVASFAPIHMRSVSLLGSALGRWTRTLLVLEGLVLSLSLSLSICSRSLSAVYRSMFYQGRGKRDPRTQQFSADSLSGHQIPKAFPTTK